MASPTVLPVPLRPLRRRWIQDPPAAVSHRTAGGGTRRRATRPHAGISPALAHTLARSGKQHDAAAAAASQAMKGDDSAAVTLPSEAEKGDVEADALRYAEAPSVQLCLVLPLLSLPLLALAGVGCYASVDYATSGASLARVIILWAVFGTLLFVLLSVWPRLFEVRSDAIVVRSLLFRFRFDFSNIVHAEVRTPPLGTPFTCHFITSCGPRVVFIRNVGLNLAITPRNPERFLDAALVALREFRS